MDQEVGAWHLELSPARQLISGLYDTGLSGLLLLLLLLRLARASEQLWGRSSGSRYWSAERCRWRHRRRRLHRQRR